MQPDSESAAAAGMPEGMSCLKEKLNGLGLRPTTQRLVLGTLLFSGGDRHVTASMLFAQASQAGHHFALATIYNVLNCFVQHGLLRQVAVEGGEAFFDTNVSNHNHFYVEHERRMLDIPDGALRVEGLPPPPEGMVVSHVDVVVRLVPKHG
ncbi:MAG: transcriptional repressor [Hyphomicrobiaceae bacterium]|nr:transcriptional repressor [Hyphomicrobiaceae bacterium]